jgi:hypothetical protein
MVLGMGKAPKRSGPLPLEFDKRNLTVEVASGQYEVLTLL